MKVKKITGTTLAIAAAALLVGCSNGDKQRMVAQNEVAGKCMGANKCKGKGACATKENACQGQNVCKGHGFVMLTPSACEKAGGKMEG